MKKISLILFSLLFILINFRVVYANEIGDNIVNIYIFHSKTCSHCKAEIKLLSELESKYENVTVYKYEVSDPDNYQLFTEVANLMDTQITGVPFTIIGDKVYKGFSEANSKSRFINTIEYYSKYSYKDVVGMHIGNIDIPSYNENMSTETEVTLDEFIKEKESYKLDIPLIGVVELKNLTLPIISILIGLVDGFNPCAMWVLLFLISMLIGMKNRKRMWVLGTTFLLTSSIIYLLFMLTWLNAATMLITVSWFRLLIGFVALIGGLINLISYFKHRKDNGCSVVNDKKRNKIFDKIRKFTQEKNFFLAIVGAMTLAVSVNIVELACSAGLPVMFIEILSMNNLTLVQEIVYIALYMLFFLLDDLVVFFIAMRTMEVTGFSTKYGKLSKVIGGILLLAIGVLMIFKPEWLMFNF